MFAASKSGSPPIAANYIEDVFSTYLYTGNGTTQTITNGIDLAGKGGLVWLKSRTNPPGGYDGYHRAVDTVLGINAVLYPNSTSVADPFSYVLNAFNSNGFSIGNGTYDVNKSGYNYVSWTLREQPKFFDIVTYTGNGANRTISHNLGSVPGAIWVKRTDASENWQCYHRSLANTEYMVLNDTAAKATSATRWNSTTPTSTVFSLGTDTTVNASGGTYVAYLFAHDAGGFGLTGTDNVISCGTFTTDGLGIASVTLGYEAQWVLIKPSTDVGNWQLYDIMRGMAVGQRQDVLYPNLSSAEVNTSNTVSLNATGFRVENNNNTTYIYIAIRRGPMKTPTSGTSVFTPIARTGTGSAATVTGVGFPTDLVLHRARSDVLVTPANMWQDRLRGIQQYLKSNNANQEFTDTSGILSLTMDGMTVGTDSAENNVNIATVDYINYFMRRAPSFFDEVCYTGTGSATTVNHNLTVVPEMMIVKRRNAAADWPVYHVAMGPTKYTFLDGSTELTSNLYWNDTAPTASVFTVGTTYRVNQSANTYVAYLFATCPGVSKVGSYTGTGALQTVACGFTSGARFVLIHRIDSGSNRWYVWDSARGITSGNDPYLALNTTEAEVTGTNYVDTDTTGFKVTAAAPAALNASGGTYIFLAIA
jgi:hypothetical protein